MKKYLAIYKRLIICNIGALLEYRSDFLTRIFASLMFSTYHLVTIFLLTYAVPTVYGWTRYELLLLASTYSVFISIFHMFISQNLSVLAEEIYYGRLDFLLLKPLDSQLTTVLWRVEFVNGIRFLLSGLLSLYLLAIMHIQLTISSIMLYFLAIFIGVVILYCLWLPFISLLIFNPRLSNIVTLLFQSSGVARYPQEMYAKLPLYIFVPLIPLTLIMTSPTKVLLHKFSYSLAIELLIVCLILATISRFVWKFSLRHYTGASA